MPWNDNANPGPWGSPGDDDKRDTPSRKPQGDGGGPRGPRRPDGPDLNAGFERLQRRLGGLFGAGGGGGQGLRPGVLAAVAGVAFGLWALSGIYVVQPNEQAVVTTFGAYSRDETPGLRYHMPYPIEAVEKVPVTSLQRVDIGGDTDDAKTSLMLTRDENIVDLNFSVTWRVSNASRFVFTVSDPENSVKAAAESAMREVVGRTDLLPILSVGRGQVQVQTAELTQRMLDSWGAGVTVVEVQIRTASPPREAVAAFQDVTNAEQDRDSAVNEANSYRNRVVNEAKGDASRIVQSAEGYREQAVRMAAGDAARFNSILGEYRRAPGATRDRLYIETMERILSKSNKVIVDGKGTSAPIILPPDVFRPRNAAPSAAAIQQQSEAQPQGAARKVPQ